MNKIVVISKLPFVEALVPRCRTADERCQNSSVRKVISGCKVKS